MTRSPHQTLSYVNTETCSVAVGDGAFTKMLGKITFFQEDKSVSSYTLGHAPLSPVLYQSF